jgi:hypothetical protein
VLALAAAFAAAVSVSAPAQVTALAADGPRVAFASGRGAGDCDRVRIWNPRTGRLVPLGRATACVSTSTGTGIAAVVIAGNRVLWLHYTGGNIREWSLFTATETARKPRRLRFVARDVDSPAPIVLGDGDAGRLGDLLPYAVDREVVALRTNGARRFAWTAPSRVVALSALDGELAVAQEGGRVTVLDPTGHALREESYAGEIAAVKLTGAGVLVQRGRTLEYRDGTGARWTAVLPAGARLADVAGATDALYVIRSEIRARRIGDARDVAVGRGTLAQVEGPWLATASGRRVTARRPYSR